MWGNGTRLTLIAALVLAFLTASGCGSQKTQDAPLATPAKLAVIDLDKAVKAHPKYADYLRLQRDYAALAARIEAEKAQGIQSPGMQPAAQAKDGAAQAAEQEFNARMAAKETELRTWLTDEADKQRQAANASLDAYGQELDKEYQGQIFNLQLRLKTVQLSKEEAAAAEAELAKLKAERADKLAARQQELAAQMNATMATKQAQSQQELAAYGGKLNTELAERLHKQQAEAADRMTPVQPLASEAGNVAWELAAKRQEAAALQDFIIADIRDKTAKIAAEQKLDAVLANVKINVSATDITAAVIAEIKK